MFILINMKIGIRITNPDIAEIKVSGEIDRAAGLNITEALESTMKHGEIRLDLSEAGLLASSFINALVVFRNQHPKQSKKLRIVKPSPDAAKILRLTNLDRIFTVTNQNE